MLWEDMGVGCKCVEMSDGDRGSGASLGRRQRLMLSTKTSRMVRRICANKAVGSEPGFSRLVRQLGPGSALVIYGLSQFTEAIMRKATLTRRLCSEGVGLRVLGVNIIRRAPIKALLLGIVLDFTRFRGRVVGSEYRTNHRCTERGGPDCGRKHPGGFGGRRVGLTLALLRRKGACGRIRTVANVDGDAIVETGEASAFSASL